MGQGLRRGVVWCAFIAFVAAAGCINDKDNFPVPTTGDDGGLPNRTVAEISGAERPTDGGRGETAGGDDAPSSTRMAVEIVSPKNADVVVGKNRFTPNVNVTVDAPTARAQDVVTEVIAVIVPTDPLSKVRDLSVKLNQTKLEVTPESTVTTYRFTDMPVDLAGLESGEYEMTATAKTAGGAEASARVKFMVDAGPVIRIEKPGENQYCRDTADVDVTITDPLFEIQTVAMTIGQRPLTFKGPGGVSGHQYTATVDFNSYNPPLEGDQLLTVRATNKNNTDSVAARKFVSDNKGPSITNTVPNTGDLIGKVIKIEAEVNDPAGVLESSVIAVVAHGDKTFEVKLQPPAAGDVTKVYSGLFDTTRLPVNALFPSISFRASDVLGNQSSVGYVVSLDNTPPLADLDPPNQFRTIKNDSGIYRCSRPFDPLGDDAVNDLDTVAQLFDVRARVQDLGNAPAFGYADFTPISGIDGTQVQLLVLDDTSQALLVDTSGDGKCDAVNPLLKPTTTPMSSTDALLINMIAVSATGTANYMPSTVPFGAPCVSGLDPKPPDALCFTTNLSIAIPYTNASTPAIWTIAPVAADGLQCVGRQFDALGNSISDGWICIAVAVADKLGNFQVSRPLRVCVDKDGKNNECVSPGPAPNCTGTVSASGPPPTIDLARPCTAWRSYPDVEYLLLR